MIHHVYANRSNIGDWLCAKAMQRLLRPLPVKEYLCDEPFVEQTLVGLRALPPRSLVVVGGGGLFMDYFAPLWEGLRALTVQLDICVWGAGYCDLKAEASHPPLDTVQEVIRNSRLCVVRDELTRGHLGDCEIPAPIACPSMHLVEATPPGGALLHVDNFTTAGEAVYEVMDEVCRFFAAQSGRTYTKTNNRIERSSEVELRQRLSLYRSSGLVVSSGLHGCIIAVAMGRPVVAVSGDRKIDEFMSMAGLGKWVLDTSEVHHLPRLLQRLHEQRPVGDFVETSNRRNAAVASRIKALHVEGVAA